MTKTKGTKIKELLESAKPNEVVDEIKHIRKSLLKALKKSPLWKVAEDVFWE
jgi:hypothetical protein